MDTKINESILNDEIREHQKENRIDHMTYLDDMEVLESEIQNQVISSMKNYDYNKYTAADVEIALKKDVLTPNDF